VKSASTRVPTFIIVEHILSGLLSKEKLERKLMWQLETEF